MIFAVGSSPRVRGTSIWIRTQKKTHRFIPACAGNILPQARSKVIKLVHPRVCGEHPESRAQASHGRRFIPACAGNISRVAATRFSKSVHPRVCGEHLAILGLSFLAAGSSPRVRGTCRRSPAHEHLLRFIPACAGNIISKGVRMPGSPVHPRVCGEHRMVGLPTSAPAGSSPRVRGTLEGSAATHRLLRFIPACAGNMPSGPATRCSKTVHPRVCGEHLAE